MEAILKLKIISPLLDTTGKEFKEDILKIEHALNRGAVLPQRGYRFHIEGVKMSVSSKDKAEYNRQYYRLIAKPRRQEKRLEIKHSRDGLLKQIKDKLNEL